MSVALFDSYPLSGGHNEGMLHQDRHRAESFGADAEQYDRARPSYPPSLVDDLLGDRGGCAVVDVGCGTGITSRLFAARGCRVLGVEADPRMAAVARRSGVEVEEGKFESWQDGGRRFDLVVSGQAWHWIEPLAGSAKAEAVLWERGKGGRLLEPRSARPRGPRRCCRSCTDGWPPASTRIRSSSALPWPSGSRRPTTGLGIERALLGARGADVPVAQDLFAARSGSICFPPTATTERCPTERLVRLLEGVGAAIDDLGGTLEVQYTTWLVTAEVA